MSSELRRRMNRHCPGCQPPATTRRGFLRNFGMGFGWLAFAGLANHAVANGASADCHGRAPPAWGPVMP